MPQPSAPTGKIFRVLGVDPAAAGATGFGVVESDGRRCRMLRFGALRATRKGPEHFPARLREIHAMLAELIEEFQPHGVAVESVFTSLNMKTALRLAEVRGVVLLAAAQQDIPVCSYSPREVKSSVAGYGHADKQQMQLMVRALLNMSETPEPADAADALAVALCHIQVAQFRARLDVGASPANGLVQGRGNYRVNPRAGERAAEQIPANDSTAPAPRIARSRGDISRISSLR